MVTVESDGKARDAERVTFGVRTAVFDADKGFFLNGNPLKIQGTCNHQDHAGVGAALPDRLQWFRLAVLREMGCNAVRTSHNMPTPEWVEACDRMGVMMMCETRQMSSNPEGMQQLETMVKRYRNSPSIIIWSIGNEEWQLQDAWPSRARRSPPAWFASATNSTRRASSPPPSTATTRRASPMPFDVIGFNYGEDRPDGFHKKYPKRPVCRIGDLERSQHARRVRHRSEAQHGERYDGVVPGAKRRRTGGSFYGTREWEAGGFAWTGFDYRGEPTPYGWPSINSQFGIVDMCGFPKDYFYYYKAWWRKEPSLHLFPHWNWRGQGRQRDSRVGLFQPRRGRTVRQRQEPGQPEGPASGPRGVEGEVRAGRRSRRAASKGGKVVLTEKRETTGPAVSIRLTADRTEIDADGEDVAILKVEALDRQGPAGADREQQDRIQGLRRRER